MPAYLSRWVLHMNSTVEWVEHDTFESYCWERWRFKKSRAYQLMDGSAVVERLEVHNCGSLPATESQARPLTKLEPDEQLVAWERAIKKAGDGKVTAAIVEEAVAELSDDAPPVEVHTKTSKDPRPQLLRDAARPIREARKLSPPGFEESQMNLLLKMIRGLIQRLEHANGEHEPA